MERFLLVCAGSAAGGGTRYLVSLWAGARLGAGFPYGTLIVNVAGCLVITLVMHVALAGALSANLRFLLTTGFCGGLTTYSTFDYETTKLVQEGRYTAAAMNVGVTMVLCFAVGLLGFAVARRIVG
ncbi:MAG TPA: fluoride efflux transporter CrcB [Kofleriaceae bacterium]|nr:fluoride efflux transporter CrcB [Kofleriaceae bacterium]